jgi:hypothetical protein
MRSAEFGDISIRTSVSQQQVTTQISLDHGELSKAISAHIPAMQEKMGNEYGRSAVVEVNHSGMAFSGERGPSQHQEQRPFIHSDYVGSSEDSTSPDYPALATVPAVADGYRLDIRA